MSWDILILNTAVKVDMEKDSWPDFPSKDHVIACVKQSFPDSDWSDPSWGILRNEHGSIEFNIGSKPQMDNTFMLHVRGGRDVSASIAAMCRQHQWIAYDISAPGFIDNDNPSDNSFEDWKDYRDQVVAGTPKQKSWWKFWTIIAILTLPACGYLQSRENETSAPTGSTIEGKKQGEWKKYYLNGRLARVENYYNDTLHGKFFSYAPDGILRARGIYKMGVIVDSFCTYNGNGTVNLQEWRDSTGKAQGVFRIYHRNGQLSQIGYHKDGYLDDTSKSFHPNGQPRSIEFYKDNKKSGTWQYFSEKGKLISTEVYENDVLVSKTR